MTEVPEHLLQRSRARRAAMGMAVEGDEAPAASAAESAAAPVAAAAAAPAVKAPVPIPAGDAPPPAEPDSAWVAAAKTRQKIPYWVMPVLLFLPIWLIMYVGTLEEPTREEGVMYEGGEVYAAECASCHGATGGGGVGPAFTGGAIVETFADAEAHLAWIVQGSQVFLDAGRSTYGDNDKALAGSNGALMPAFGAKLTAEELIAVVFYERVELSGHEDELAMAEAIWDKLEHGDLDGEHHFVEGTDGDLDGIGEIAEFLAEVMAELAEAEVATG